MNSATRRLDVTQKRLIPTDEDLKAARLAYFRANHDVPSQNAERLGNNAVGVLGRAQLMVLAREYPQYAHLLGNLKLDAPMGFGYVDVGLDPVKTGYFHVLLSPEDFLSLCEDGNIVLDEDGYPDYTGNEELRPNQISVEEAVRLVCGE